MSSSSQVAVPIRTSSPTWDCHTGSSELYSTSDSSNNDTHSNNTNITSLTSTQKKKIPFWGFLCLTGGILLHIALGTVYTFGVSSLYFISYIKNTTDPTLRITCAATLMAAEFSAMAIGMPLGGALERKLGPKAVSLLGGLVFVSGVYISRFTISKSFVSFLLSYGVLYGFGLGIAYTSPLVAALSWFPKHQGLISGLITAGFGLGSVIFAPLQHYLFNPSGISPTWRAHEDAPTELYYNNPTLLEAIPSVFPYLAGIYVSLVLIAVCFISSRKKEETEKLRVFHQDPQPPLAKILTSKPFLLLWSTFLLEGISIIFLASFWKPLAAVSSTAKAHNQLSETQLAAVGAAASAANALGRILWGKYADLKSFQHSLCLLAGLWCGALLLLSYASSLHWFLYAATVCFNFFCLGGNFALFPAGTAAVFGQQAVGRVYGFVFMAQLGSSLVGAFLLPPLSQHLGIPAACRVVSLCCLIVSSLLLALRGTKIWQPFKP